MALVSYKSFAQAWKVILKELSIDYQGIELAGLVTDPGSLTEDIQYSVKTLIQKVHR